MRRVKAERLRRGWTQLELANRAGIHPNDVSRMETREVLCPGHLPRVAEVLGCKPEELLQDVELEVASA